MESLRTQPQNLKLCRISGYICGACLHVTCLSFVFGCTLNHELRAAHCQFGVDIENALQPLRRQTKNLNLIIFVYPCRLRRLRGVSYAHYNQGSG